MEPHAASGVGSAMAQSYDYVEPPPDCGDCVFPTVDLNRDAILLDVDGTIVDIAITPESVNVPGALKDSLEILLESTNGALALVSGRTLQSVDALFAPLKTAAAGCHGAQLRKSATADVTSRFSPLPEALKQTCSDIARQMPRVRVEDKTYAVAFHYRKARERRDDLLALLREKMAPYEQGYVLMAGKSVFEIKPRNCTKGEAVRALMQSSPFAGRRPVFFGDDTTDEYAFAAMVEFDGVGVSVGRRMSGAQYAVSAPRDVRRFLDTLAYQKRSRANG
jgi:trehalose 6-phosphate phosphatase